MFRALRALEDFLLNLWNASLLTQRCVFCIAAFAIGAHGVAAKRSAPMSKWARAGSSGRLEYGTLSAGDRIVDFSYAGYGGGGVSLPTVPVKRSVTPSGQDDSASIQSALDEISKLPLIEGVRGALVLGKGTFHCSSTLRLNADGVVIRGSGSGDDGTVIEMTGDPHLAFSIGSKSTSKPVGVAAKVTDPYIASGSQSLSLSDTSHFAVGDRVQIIRPVTPEWVHFMGMDELIRNGKKETWVSGEIRTERTIAAISGTNVGGDGQLTDSYD